jgi:hypothetical protein
MHKSDRRGYLQQTSGKRFTPEQIARIAGSSAEEVSRLVAELTESGAASVSGDGILFSPRMLQDERLRQVRSSAGRRGGQATASLLKQMSINGSGKSCREYSDRANGNECLPTSDRLKWDIGRERATGPPRSRDFELTAPGLAQEWCFFLTRKRHGSPKDSVPDMTSEFDELIRLGIDPAKIRVALRDPQRDRGEHFWQFKARLMNLKGGNNGTAARNRSGQRYDPGEVPG